jgi:hypothetical protein
MSSTQITRVRPSRKSSLGVCSTQSRHKPAFLPAAAYALSLPRFDGVAGRVAVVSSGHAGIAEALIHADVMQPHHWSGDAASSIQAVFSEHTDTLDLPMAVAYSDDPDGEWDMGLNSEECSLGKLGEFNFGYAIQPTEHRYYFVGESLSRLETLQVGLGTAILDTASRAMSEITGLMTPKFVYGIGSYLNPWDDDQREDMSLEEIAESYKPEDFRKNIPAFMLAGVKPTKDFTKLKLKVPRGEQDRIQEIMEVVQKLNEVPAWPDNHMEYTEQGRSWLCAPIILRASKDDDIPRLLDDMHELECQSYTGGCYDKCFASVFDLNKPTEVKKAFGLFKPMFEAIRNLERLVDLIGVREDRY